MTVIVTSLRQMTVIVILLRVDYCHRQLTSTRKVPSSPHLVKMTVIVISLRQDD
jgi:hypothetical protein